MKTDYIKVTMYLTMYYIKVTMYFLIKGQIIKNYFYI